MIHYENTELEKAVNHAIECRRQLEEAVKVEHCVNCNRPMTVPHHLDFVDTERGKLCLMCCR